MDNIKRYYDLTSQKVAEEWYPNNMLLPSIKDYLSLLKIRPRILDLGCGTGHESMRLSNEGAEVVGIDFSSESINIAKDKNKNITFYVMDYFSITRQQLGMYDAIFSTGSIIHLNEDKLNELLLITQTILNDNGFFLVIFQSGTGQRVGYPEINGEKIERTVELYTKEQMIKIFANNGYKYIKDGFIDDLLKKYWINLIFQK